MVGEDSDIGRAAEVLGVIVIEAGAGSLDGVAYQPNHGRQRRGRGRTTLLPPPAGSGQAYGGARWISGELPTDRRFTGQRWEQGLERGQSVSQTLRVFKTRRVSFFE